MNRRVARRDQGFSLIETMVALSLMVVGILAINRMHWESRRMVHDSERHRAALWLARDKVEQKLGLPYRELTTLTRGSERLEGNRLVGEDQHGGIVLTWTVDAHRRRPGVAMVRATTHWTQRGRPRSTTVIGVKAPGHAP